MARIARRVLAALAIGTLFVVGAFSWTPAPAGAAQGLDLCDLLGDPYCPPDTGNGSITCTGSGAPGSSGTCTVGNVDVGDDITATLVCGDYSATVFSGTVTEVPFTFAFQVPDDAPVGNCTIQVAGASLPFSVVTSSLARTGSDTAPLLAIGGGLVAVGLAAAFGAKRRMRTAEPV